MRERPLARPRRGELIDARPGLLRRGQPDLPSPFGVGDAQALLHDGLDHHHHHGQVDERHDHPGHQEAALRPGGYPGRDGHQDEHQDRDAGCRGDADDPEGRRGQGLLLQDPHHHRQRRDGDERADEQPEAQ